MAKKVYQDSVRLHSGQSLMSGNPKQLAAKSKFKPEALHSDVQNFGLWDVAVPNFSNYYPDVTEDDLVIKESEFINPVFRLLSEVIVHKKWNPIDFSMNGVLKASMNKLIGQTVYANHEAHVGNEIGAVSSVSWQNSYTSNGILIPAGINGIFNIDAKSNPKIARNILMEPPAIHSNSVTVQFAWEKSHEIDDSEFWGKLATYGSDGQLIRRVVTEVQNYHETSLVSHGADPFAQKIGADGKIVNPDYAGSVYGLSAKPEGQKLFYFSYKDDVASLSEKNTIPDELNNNNSDNTQNGDRMKKSFVLLLATLAGITLSDKDKNSTDEAFASDFDFDSFTQQLKTAFEGKDGQISQLTSQLAERDTQLAAANTSLTTANAELGPLKTVKTEMDSFKQSRIDEVTRLYNLLNPQPIAAILESFKVSDIKTLSAFEKQYLAELDNKMPATCNSCGSHDVNRGSAEGKFNENAGGKGGDDTPKKSVAEKVAELAQAKRQVGSTNNLHQADVKK